MTIIDNALAEVFRREIAQLATDTTRAYALAMQLGEVKRATTHPSGLPETDTTHTVGLQLVCLTVAPRIERVLRVTLDRGRLLTYALVHDLVEAYAGDVNTLRPLTQDQRQEKHQRERAALHRIGADLPHLADAIEAYEASVDLEAEVVHYLDKACPKFTHALNGGETLRRERVGVHELRDLQARQNEQLAFEHPRLYILDRLLRELGARAEAAVALRDADLRVETYRADGAGPNMRHSPGPALAGVEHRTGLGPPRRRLAHAHRGRVRRSGVGRRARGGRPVTTIHDLPYPVPGDSEREANPAGSPRTPRSQPAPSTWRRFLKPDEKWVDPPSEDSP